jgi:AcrR family transcriptional regulator
MLLSAAKVDPRIRRTRQMLFQAFRALLAEKTFDLISVQDITERSTLNRATFYDHFTDKFALLEAMIGEGFSSRIEERLAGSKGGCQKHQRQFEPLTESRVKAILREWLLEGLRQNQAENPELKATMVSWAIAGAALQWSREKKTSADELADAILPTLHTALKAGER